ncbi:MAG: hypothetical protein M0P45_03515 [Candidatus Cloacimonas sp.]|nr:hypothetical protein [Candidatus Cloacimonas sp.]HPN26890.1 hypothetical protein [Candidatus Cloacimonas sp.]HQP63031.1 hypothetical protein [Candidatus Cloacimonas sp.]
MIFFAELYYNITSRLLAVLLKPERELLEYNYCTVSLTYILSIMIAIPTYYYFHPWGILANIIIKKNKSALLASFSNSGVPYGI